MAASGESSSEPEQATGRENERENILPSACMPTGGSTLIPGPAFGTVTRPGPLTLCLGSDTTALSREGWASSWLIELERPAQRLGRWPFSDAARTQCPRVPWAPRRMRRRSLRFQRRRCKRKGSLNSKGLGMRKSMDIF